MSFGRLQGEYCGWWVAGGGVQVGEDMKSPDELVNDVFPARLSLTYFHATEMPSNLSPPPPPALGKRQDTSSE